MIAGSLAQLAALGVIGPAVFTVLFTLLGVGLGLVPLLGVGLLLLYVLVYAMYATAWLEYARVDGLYGLELPPVRVRRSSRPGFGGFLRMVWAQFTDPIVWRGIASIAVSTVLGLLVVPLLTAVIAGIAGAFAPLYAGETVRLFGIGLDVGSALAVPVGIVGALAASAALVGLATVCSAGRSSSPPAKPSSPTRRDSPRSSVPARCDRPRWSAPGSSAISTTACSRDWSRSG